MKKTYNTPELARFGSISELTLAGRTNAGADGVEYKDDPNDPDSDTFNGSVCKDGGGAPVTCT